MCKARHVWKPFACAEIPRIAWKDTGRPVISLCFSPRKSVHSIGRVISCSKATCANSAARRLIVSSETPHCSATFAASCSGDIYVSAILWKTVVCVIPAWRIDPFKSGFTPFLSKATFFPEFKSITSGLLSLSRRNNP